MPELCVEGAAAVLADVRAIAAPAAPAVYADVGVTHPVHLARNRVAADAAGDAARGMEGDKRDTYAGAGPDVYVPTVVPLTFETFGRWGPAAEAELVRLAKRRVERCCAHSALDPRPSFWGSAAPLARAGQRMPHARQL